MLDFDVNEETCIRCGECVADCPLSVLEMGEAYPVIHEGKGEQCIQCQHCFAVCPTGALSIFGLDPDLSSPLKGNLPDPAKVEVLMRGRRSTRRYKSEPVEKEMIDRILDVIRNAPTGVNRRTTRLTLVDDLSVMDELRRQTYAGLRKAVEEDALPPGMEFFAGMLDAWDKGVDVLYRGAPHFIVASAPADGLSSVPDCFIALTYFELLANSHGLGTVWDGLANWALKTIAPDAAALLGIPDDHETVYTMAFGKPAVHYHRTVQRPGGSIHRVTL